MSKKVIFTDKRKDYGITAFWFSDRFKRPTIWKDFLGDWADFDFVSNWELI